MNKRLRYSLPPALSSLNPKVQSPYKDLIGISRPPLSFVAWPPILIKIS